MVKNYLGIDIGTTTVKACLIDECKRIVRQAELAHEATIRLPDVNRHEQCPKRLLSTVFQLLGDRFADVLSTDGSELGRVGVCGQMHGVVLWNGESVRNAGDPSGWLCSNLITWMDQRCGSEFLASLPQPNEAENCRVASGYGCATLAFEHAHGRLDPRWDRCGTIMELFITAITAADRVPISTQNAYSWGYCTRDEWQVEALRSIVPVELLPAIAHPGHTVGETRAQPMTHLPAGIEVTVALGDSQSSYFPILRAEEAVLHIGTSAQLVLLANGPISSAIRRECPALMIWPYFRTDETLAVAASLNGGNAIDTFAAQIGAWSHELYGTPINPSIRYDIVENCMNAAGPSSDCSLEMAPRFRGERHEPSSRASLSGWSGRETLGEMLRAIAAGTVRNLRQMMPPALDECFGINRIRLTGRAVLPAYRAATVAEFPRLDVSVADGEMNAAYGCALFTLLSSE